MIVILNKCQCSPGYKIDKGCRWCNPQDTIEDLEDENKQLIDDLERHVDGEYALDADLDNIKDITRMYFDAIEIGLKDSDIKNIRERLERLAE